ncbi:MAG: thioesterase family protein [Planctomycetota bacterium]
MTFKTRLRYRFGDIDEAGIAYYPKLLHYFHCAFEDWWSDGLGHAYPRLLHEDKLGLPAVKLEAEFFAPVRYGDEPWVHLGVLRIGNSSVEFAMWMTRGDDPQPLCRARVLTAAVDMDTMQKRELPAIWRERFAAFALAEADFPTPRPQSP